MINIGEVRDRLGEALAGLELPVETRAPSGVLHPPMVLLGMPTWQAVSSDRLDTMSMPVVVVVAARSASPEAAVDELDALWPSVADRLRNAARSDQTLGGAVSDTVVESSMFSPITIAGHEYPAQTITVKLYNYDY